MINKGTDREREKDGNVINKGKDRDRERWECDK